MINIVVIEMLQLNMSLRETEMQVIVIHVSMRFQKTQDHFLLSSAANWFFLSSELNTKR